jgi:hypothetical protein
MGETKTTAKTAGTPALNPLPPSTKLAPTPRQTPKYAVTVRNRAGEPVTLADPRVTRALVALMDMHAVVGGAASHWGGPSAFAEINAAVHGLMFATEGREWFEAFNTSTTPAMPKTGCTPCGPTTVSTGSPSRTCADSGASRAS